MAAELAIEATGLRKRHKDKQALDGIDLSVPSGSVLALLGPNGAGKTTTVRVLSTLLAPDSGTARVAGHDVVRRPADVRRNIALAGQYAAVDTLLTGRQNLVLIGTMLHLGRTGARRRAEELLARYGLLDAADRPVGTYSGGMRRRLDLASCLVVRPAVLFLDEPTTGLDPASRNLLWKAVRDLVADGVTVLLTTQYLEEADQLADRIVVLADGRVIADGTADQLKNKVGQARLEFTVADRAALPAARAALARVTGGDAHVDEQRSTVALAVTDGLDDVATAATALRDAGVRVAEFGLRRPTLDDVFLHLTGQAPTAQGASPDLHS
ncbi:MULTISPECIES: ATP-binding cassette domain-containing protein [Streptomyces]|uniref:ATP-binding cassette domain-containing protein n=1 Tax=Streptomyces lycii TaxID=2654337 RepID=A0ABQ7FD86_9ACTN|nr:MULTISPECIES: ATP-binding cassette domain-containing protein [Streptomyces]KAF4406785.1 ATP-binding cassette domain-containing protein [Streptomyces lycii]PGH49859.1 daunorubicin/doxorubicin resistance ABC transporter ATP-binding protein DrrA [Streptomyces sp. Ru87]